jgi:hypothetical protein
VSPACREAPEVADPLGRIRHPTENGNDLVRNQMLAFRKIIGTASTQEMSQALREGLAPDQSVGVPALSQGFRGTAACCGDCRAGKQKRASHDKYCEPHAHPADHVS